MQPGIGLDGSLQPKMGMWQFVLAVELAGQTVFHILGMSDFQASVHKVSDTKLRVKLIDSKKISQQGF